MHCLVAPSHTPVRWQGQVGCVAMILSVQQKGKLGQGATPHVLYLCALLPLLPVKADGALILLHAEQASWRETWTSRLPPPCPPAPGAVSLIFGPAHSGRSEEWPRRVVLWPPPREASLGRGGRGRHRPLGFTSYTLTPPSQRKPCPPPSAFLSAPFPVPPTEDLWF